MVGGEEDREEEGEGSIKRTGDGSGGAVTRSHMGMTR